jgi:hypothetical protein
MLAKEKEKKDRERDTEREKDTERICLYEKDIKGQR